jgi:hypothetical protein
MVPVVLTELLSDPKLPSGVSEMLQTYLPLRSHPAHRDARNDVAPAPFLATLRPFAGWLLTEGVAGSNLVRGAKVLLQELATACLLPFLFRVLATFLIGDSCDHAPAMSSLDE